jgi:hypothetical protein
VPLQHAEGACRLDQNATADLKLASSAGRRLKSERQRTPRDQSIARPLGRQPARFIG